jgi:hypothetical protein
MSPNGDDIPWGKRVENREQRINSQLIFFGRDQFEFLPDLIEGGLFIIDDTAGAVKAFDATDRRANGTNSQKATIKLFFITHGIKETSDDETDAFFFILQFTLEILVKTFPFRAGEGTGIKTMLEIVRVTDRGTVTEGISVTGLSAALASFGASWRRNSRRRLDAASARGSSFGDDLPEGRREGVRSLVRDGRS